MPARFRENRVAHFGLGLMNRWWSALADRKPWLFSLPPGTGVAR